jgi:hypothetical protein
MVMRCHGFPAITVLLGAIGLVLGAAASEVEPPPQPAQIPFQQYRQLPPHSSRYKAFAVEPESGEWGQSQGLSSPGQAVEQAVKACRRRGAVGCRAYAVGDIAVLGLADGQTGVALILYQVQPDATNGDLANLTSPDGGAAAATLRRRVLHTAAEMNETGALAAMLDLGVAVDAASDVGATALSYAASRGHRAAVALLLARRADVNARNNIGKTALGIAILGYKFARQRNSLAADHEGVIRMLRAAGGIE